MSVGVITFGVQLGSVLGEALEADLLPQELEELLQGGTCRLVVVHFLLCALPCSAIHHPDFHLKTQLETSKDTHRKIFRDLCRTETESELGNSLSDICK